MQKSAVGRQQEMTLVNQTRQGIQRCFIQHICSDFRWLALASSFGQPDAAVKRLTGSEQACTVEIFNPGQTCPGIPK